MTAQQTSLMGENLLPRNNSAQPSTTKLILFILALAIFFIASLNYLQFQTQTQTASRLHHDDIHRSSSESKRMKNEMQRQLNQALKEVDQLKSQLSALNESRPSDTLPAMDPLHLPPIIQLTQISTTQPQHVQKASSINSFWWPSRSSGLLGQLHTAQNPPNCGGERTKFFVWRSVVDFEKDSRGLSAWGHAYKSHLMHGEHTTY